MSHWKEVIHLVERLFVPLSSLIVLDVVLFLITSLADIMEQGDNARD